LQGLKWEQGSKALIKSSTFICMCVLFFSFCRKKNRRNMYINVNGAQCRYLLCSARISQTSNSQHSAVFIAYRV